MGQLIKSGCLKRFVLLTTHWLEQVTWCWFDCRRLKSSLQFLGGRELDIGNFKCVTSETRQGKANMYLSLLSCSAETTLEAMCFRSIYKMVGFLLVWILEWHCGTELLFDLN